MAEKYYILDPDEGSYFVSISDLNQTQMEYISKTIDLDIDETEGDEEIYERGYHFKYITDAPCYMSNKFDDLLDYLHKEGFCEV